MATTDNRTQRNDGPVNEPDYLSTHKGLPLGTRIKSWMVTLDHKRIGVMYLTGILISLIVGGAFALLVRTELWAPGKTLVDADTYNKFFTLHGAVMVFLVIIPGIPAALGNIIMPIQLGAPDVAFPRLNLASFYLWISGALFLVIAIPFGGLDTGWTLYTPYSLQSPTPVLLSVIGVFLLGFSSIFTGLNFLVTIHKFRPQGMTWFQMPLNIWAIYATAIMQVLATPVLGITVGLLAVERFAHIGIFDPNMGGDPVLFQHFFWFYSHPAVYIMIIPAMGVISEMLSTFSRKPIFGYRFIAYSSVSLALLSFIVWGHHMFVSGQSRLANMVFSALTFTVGIPAAIKVFNWVATLYKGDIRLKTPMIYTLSFLLLFTIGGLTGLFLGVLAIDVHLHDTYFVVAHFHYVMMGSTLVAFLGALHHWWPKFTGRMYNETVGRWCGIGVFIGFNLTFLPQFVMGSQGMPRRYWDYDARYTIYHQLSTIGAFILGISMFITIVSLVASLKNGKRAPRNPWGGSSLEWQCPTPPPLYNFEKPPVVHELYNYDDLVEVEEDVWERRSPEHVESHAGTAHEFDKQPVVPIVEGRKADEEPKLPAEGKFVGAVEPPAEPRKRKPTEPPPIPDRAKRLSSAPVPPAPEVSAPVRPAEIKAPAPKAEEPKVEPAKVEEAKPDVVKTIAMGSGVAAEEARAKTPSSSPVPPKAEEPKVEEPKVEAKAEEAKAEEPRAKTPSVPPKAEEAKAEEPRAKTASSPPVPPASVAVPPKADAPKVEAQVEAPKADEPKVEAPTVEPKVEEPKVEAKAKAEEAKVEEPKVEEPRAKTPSVPPKADEPKVEEPTAEEPKPSLTAGWDIPELPADLKAEVDAKDAPKADDDKKDEKKGEGDK